MTEPMSTAVLKILYGPPGTGKTYRAAREAVLAIDGSLPKGDPMPRYRELVEVGQIWPVTFHPSYTYEDFVEGFRPILRQGIVTYEVRDGPFKMACESVGRTGLRQGDEIGFGTAKYKVEAATREVVTIRPQRASASSTRKFIPVAMISAIAGAIREGKIGLSDLNFAKGVDVAKEQKEKVAAATDVNPFYLSDSGLIQSLVARELSGTLVPGDRLEDQNGKPKYRVKSVDSQSAILESKPDREDEVAKVQTRIVDLTVVRRAQDLGLPPDVFSIAGANDYELARFSLKGDEPKLEAEPGKPPEKRSGPVLRRYFAGLLGLSSTDMSNCGHYGAVMSRLNEIGKVGRRRVAMVIDEINRGDLSRIFGELLTLLEHDKREGQPEERRIFLPYSQQWFSVPAELSVIGTMNTADKSLSVIDFALRRRFEFSELLPDPTLCPSSYGDVDIGALLAKWNNRITTLRSRDYRIGHAELMLERLEAVRAANGFPATPEGQRRTLAWTIRRKIVPLLIEYFHDEWRKADVVLGLPSFFEPHTPADAPSYYEEVADIADSTSFDLASWSDPFGATWKDQQLLDALKKATS